MAEYYKVFNSGCPSIQGNTYSHNPFRLAEITRSSFPKRGQSNLREFVNELFQSDWRFQAVPPMEASHNGIAAHSQLCYQGQADEPFHLSETGGKILDLGQQHGQQRQQVFFVMTVAYEM